MKTWILASTLSLALIGLGIARQEHLLASSPENQVFYLPQLSQAEIEQFFEHPSPSSILVCPQGTSLSLNLFLTGDLLDLQSSKDSAYLLNIKQTFYLRLQEEQIWMSLDGLTWKTWQEMSTGMLSLTLNIQEEGPQMQMGAEINLR